MITSYDIIQKDYETILHYMTVEENTRREEQGVVRASYGIQWELYKDGNDQIKSDKYKLPDVVDDQSVIRKKISLILKGRREKNALLVILGYHLYTIKSHVDIDKLCKIIYEKGVSQAYKSEGKGPLKDYLQMVQGIGSITDNKSFAVNLYRSFKEAEYALG